MGDAIFFWLVPRRQAIRHGKINRNDPTRPELQAQLQGNRKNLQRRGGGQTCTVMILALLRFFVISFFSSWKFPFVLFLFYEWNFHDIPLLVLFCFINYRRIRIIIRNPNYYKELCFFFGLSTYKELFCFFFSCLYICMFCMFLYFFDHVNVFLCVLVNT